MISDEEVISCRLVPVTFVMSHVETWLCFQLPEYLHKML